MIAAASVILAESGQEPDWSAVSSALARALFGATDPQVADAMTGALRMEARKRDQVTWQDSGESVYAAAFGASAMKDILGAPVEHANWGAALDDDRAIAAYIASIASDYVNEELIEEYFRDMGAVLCWVPIDRLIEGDPDHNERSEVKERRYAKKKPGTMPPLVVDEDGTVRDGNHRLRVEQARGTSHLLCYVAVGDEVAQKIRYAFECLKNVEPAAEYRPA